MRQILFNFGSFSPRSYGLIVAVALLLGLGVAYSLASHDEEKEYRPYLLDIVIYGLVGGIIGARLWRWISNCEGKEHELSCPYNSRKNSLHPRKRNYWLSHTSAGFMGNSQLSHEFIIIKA